MKIGSLFELDEEYYKKACELKEKIEIVLVGCDPYPNNAERIPFIKKSFNELKKNHAGYKIFATIFEEEFNEISKNKTPKELAFEMLEKKKILLLNASYNYVQGKNRAEFHDYYIKAFEKNKKFFIKNIKIICCGEVSNEIMKKMLDRTEGEITLKKMRHPTLRGVSLEDSIKIIRKEIYQD